MNSIRLSAPIAALLLTCASLGATRVADAQDRSTAQLVADLGSDNAAASAAAFEALRARPGGLDAPGVARALAHIVEQDNALIESTLQSSNGKLGIADVYGEDFAEALGAVAEECASRCDLSDSRVALALSRALPGEDPITERIAARQGPAILPHFVADAYNEGGKDSGISRQRNALVWLGVIGVSSKTLSAAETAALDSALVSCVARSCPPGIASAAVLSIGNIVQQQPTMSPSRRRALHAAVVLATSSPENVDRIRAVDALGEFRDPADLPLLAQMAAKDRALGARVAAATAKIRAVRP